MLTHAFSKSFTAHNIGTGFRRAGICPFDASQLLGSPRPESADQVDNILSVPELERLLEEKRSAMRRAVLGDDATITYCGFIDTSKGAVLTSAKDLCLAREKHRTDAEKRQMREIMAASKAKTAAECNAMQRTEAKEFTSIGGANAERWREFLSP